MMETIPPAVIDNPNAIPLVGRRFQNLDGARTIAVGLVILSHALAGFDPKGILHALAAPLKDGETGVSIFFVISGFLITSLLRREMRNTGGISLKGFYTRRVRRIFPALYVYLGVVGVFALAHWLPISLNGFLRAVFFLRDYPSPNEWTLGHLWSLSVEEQFYLIWPLLVLRLSARAALRLSLAIIAIEPIIRTVSYFAIPSSREFLDIMFHSRADMLMFGCALALFSELPSTSRSFTWKRQTTLAGIAALVLFLVTPILDAYLHGRYTLVVGFSVTGLCATFLLRYIMTAPATSRVTKVLSQPVVARAGVLSYSLYLWQQLVLSPQNTTFLKYFPLNILLVVLLADLSNRFVEVPFLQYRQRLELGENPRSTAFGASVSQ